MSISELRDFLDTLTSHITFEYNGLSCGIDPLSRKEYDMWYGDNTITVESLDEVFNTEFFDGKTIIDIWDDVSEVEY